MPTKRKKSATKHSSSMDAWASKFKPKPKAKAKAKAKDSANGE